jgi:GMP reductase
MRVENEIKYDFSDVLIRPKRSTLSSRKDVNLERAFKFIHSNKQWTGVPIVASNMDSTGTFEMAIELSKHKMLTALHKFYTVEELKQFLPKLNQPDYVAYTLGIKDDDFNKLKEILKLKLEQYFNFIVLDVPNAYLQRYVQKLKELRNLLPHHTIIAGNVVTNEMTEELILNGADIVKIGIGSGAACTTRRMTGVGYPQLSAVIECADASHGITNSNPGCGLIMSDGGAVFTSDIAKAFCAGSDFVMLGSLFSGYDQSGGELIERDGKKFKQFYGMSSFKAQEKYYGEIKKYRASEGRNLEVPYKGDVNNFIQEVLGGLRSTGTYIGARNLKEFSRRATFIRVNKQLNTSLERYDKD